jgi:hypothetical protein
MNFFTLELDAGKCVEVCCASGPRDGAVLGYAMLFAGTWDGWMVEETNHRAMCKVAISVETKEEAIRAIVGPEAGRCSCSFAHPPHDWCDGNPDAVLFEIAPNVHPE